MPECLASFMLSTAQRTHNNICIQFENRALTFVQMAWLTKTFSRVLLPTLRKGTTLELAEQNGEAVPPPHGRRPSEHIIMLAIQRSPECVAAMHAIMLAGCAYTYFDPSEPKAKMMTWISVADPPVLMTNAIVKRHLGFKAGNISGGRVCIDTDQVLLEHEKEPESSVPHALPEFKIHPGIRERLAYCIFTGGSTGAPKSVMVQHSSACPFVRAWAKEQRIVSSHRMAQTYSFAFDAHLTDVYVPIMAGAVVVVAPKYIVNSGKDMFNFLAREKITTLDC